MHNTSVLCLALCHFAGVWNLCFITLLCCLFQYASEKRLVRTSGSFGSCVSLCLPLEGGGGVSRRKESSRRAQKFNSSTRLRREPPQEEALGAAHQARAHKSVCNAGSPRSHLCDTPLPEGGLERRTKREHIKAFVTLLYPSHLRSNVLDTSSSRRKAFLCLPLEGGGGVSRRKESSRRAQKFNSSTRLRRELPQEGAFDTAHQVESIKKLVTQAHPGRINATVSQDTCFASRRRVKGGARVNKILLITLSKSARRSL